MNEFDDLDDLAKDVDDFDLQRRLRGEIVKVRQASELAQKDADPLHAIEVRIATARDPREAAYWLRIREEWLRQNAQASDAGTKRTITVWREAASNTGALSAVGIGLYLFLHGSGSEGWILMGAGFGSLGIKLSRSLKGTGDDE